MTRKALHFTAAMAVTAALVAITTISPPVAHADNSSDLLSMINAARVSAGRPALVVDATLTAAAQQWSQQMATTGVLADPGVALKVPAGWTKVGENVGSGADMTAIFTAWKSQPDHYAIMVDPAFTLAGVAVVSNSNGVLYASNFLEARKATTTTVARASTTTVAKTTTTSAATTTTSEAPSPTTTGLGSATTTTAPFGTGAPIAVGPVHGVSHGTAPWVYVVGGAALLALIGAGYGLRRRLIRR